MLVFMGVLALVGLGTPLDIEGVIPSRFEIEDSINRTIEEVEKMVQENPNLPKLSRDNIVDILYNITSNDMMSIEEKAQKAIEKTREHYQRALMVVLPHKPQQTGESLMDLYTKPPIVKLVADEAPVTKDSFVQTSYNTPRFQQSENAIENKHQVVKTHMRFSSSSEATLDYRETPPPSPSTTKTAPSTVKATTASSTTLSATTVRITTTPATTVPSTTAPATTEQATTVSATTVPSTTPLSSTSTAAQKYKLVSYRMTNPEADRFRVDLQIPDLKVEASHNSAATKRPVYKGSFSRYRTSTITPPKVEIIYKPTPKMKTTTESSKESTTGINTETPTPSNDFDKDVMLSDQWNYRAPQRTQSATSKPQTYTPSKEPIAPTKNVFLPTIQTASDQSVNSGTTRSSLPAKTTTVAPTTTTSKPSTIFVTPEVQITSKRPQAESRATTTVSPTTTTTVSSTPMRAEVKQLLKSIGLQPMKPTESVNNDLSIDSVDALLKAQSVDLDLNSGSKHSETNQKDNSFENPPTEIKHGVKNLSPEIQLLFQQFGLQNSGKDNTIHESTTAKVVTTPKPTRKPVDVNSYTRFKPLPTSQVKDRDFRDFLARFGLGVSDTRNQKAVQPRPNKKQPPSLLDAIPGNMKKILENVGLIKRTPKAEANPQIVTQRPRSTEQTPQTTEHVFKPKNAGADREQTERIKTLLDTVRMVQQGKADVQDVQKIAQELLESSKTLGGGPDPIKLEEILNNYRDNLKNEVKRQQEKTTTTTTTTTTTAPTTTRTTSTTTTVASLTDLEQDELTTPTTALTDASTESTKAKAKPSSDQSSSSSDAREKSTAKPSFFDTFDPEAFLKETSSTTSGPSSASSTAKPNFFDTFDPEAFLKNSTSSGDKDEAGPSPGELEESFGGGSTAEPDPEIPTRPKTGLYFLVDWNSFLKVGGEDDKDPVNLSFSPKVLRNRHRFIPVDLVQRTSG